MGEIRIKSGNLFDVNGEHTTLVWDGKECLVIENDAIIVNQIRPGYMTGIYYDKEYKEGTYTLIIQADSSQFINRQARFVSSAPFLGGAWNESYRSYIADMNKQDALHYISFTVNEPTKIGFFVNGYFESGDKLVNIQLLEGTYTSETIPEYQPYFLNRPAHQVTNGQFVDIPTHHYTNGRWQGELTSQSPLKFRADGEMLDWRVEGRTSGNLFDVKHFVDTAYCHNVVLTQLDNGLEIQATSSNDPYANYVNGVIGQTLPTNMRNAVIPCEPNTDYTLHCVQSSRLGKYISYFDKDYKVVKNYTPFSGTPLNFKTPETCVFILLRIGDRSTLSEGTTVELNNIQIIEGTYTSDTLPPYEPYGGVGDYDETEQKYVIPVRVEGENLFNPETSTPVYIDASGNEHPSEKSLTSDYISVNANTMYTLGLTGDTDSTNSTAYCFYNSNKEFISSSTYVPSANGNIVNVLTPNDCAYFRFSYNHLRELVEFVEGQYNTLPPYSTITNIFTDHQLMDGDSIDYTTTETQIPLATGNNTLTVDTAVKPKSVFVKFEG